MQSSHPLHIAPHIVLAADSPRPCKVIQVLLRVDVAEFALTEEACPQNVPSCVGHMSKACHFECVDHTVVCVRAIRHFESWCAVRLELVLRVLNDARIVTRQVSCHF